MQGLQARVDVIANTEYQYRERQPPAPVYFTSPSPQRSAARSDGMGVLVDLFQKSAWPGFQYGSTSCARGIFVPTAFHTCSIFHF